MPDLQVDVRDIGDWTVVDVTGEVDLHTAPALKERLQALAAEGKCQVIVNLEGVDFLDSTGLGVLIGSLKRCREQGGNLSLAGPRDHVRKVLSITGLERVLDVHDTVAEATSA